MVAPAFVVAPTLGVDALRNLAIAIGVLTAFLARFGCWWPCPEWGHQPNIEGWPRALRVVLLLPGVASEVGGRGIGWSVAEELTR